MHTWACACSCAQAACSASIWLCSACSCCAVASRAASAAVMRATSRWVSPTMLASCREAASMRRSAGARAPHDGYSWILNSAESAIDSFMSTHTDACISSMCHSKRGESRILMATHLVLHGVKL